MSLVLYHGGSMISEGFQTCRRAAVVETIYTSLRSIYRAIQGDGDKELEEVLKKLHGMNIESDIEIMNSVLKDTENDMKEPLCVCHKHLNIALQNVQTQVDSLNMHIHKYKKKWWRSRRVLCVDEELEKISISKSTLDHQFNRFVQIQTMYFSKN